MMRMPWPTPTWVSWNIWIIQETSSSSWCPETRQVSSIARILKERSLGYWAKQYKPVKQVEPPTWQSVPFYGSLFIFLDLLRKREGRKFFKFCQPAVPVLSEPDAPLHDVRKTSQSCRSHGKVKIPGWTAVQMRIVCIFVDEKAEALLKQGPFSPESAHARRNRSPDRIPVYALRSSVLWKCRICPALKEPGNILLCVSGFSCTRFGRLNTELARNYYLNHMRT
jgi:hypothetical protein